MGTGVFVGAALTRDIEVNKRTINSPPTKIIFLGMVLSGMMNMSKSGTGIILAG